VSLDNIAEVETPERVQFRYQVAGPTRRALAYLVDLALRLFLLGLLWLILSVALGVAPNALNGIVLVLLFVLEWGYYVYFETWGGGRSPGKRLLSLVVVKRGGFPVGFIDSVLRNLLRAADFLPVGYVLGALAMAGDAQFRRLGDHVAGTLVVIERRARVAAPLTISPPPTAEELDRIPVRPPLSPWERETLDLFMRRSDLLGLDRRDELAQTVAPVLAQRMGVTYTNPVRFLALLHHRAQGGPAATQGQRR